MSYTYKINLIGIGLREKRNMLDQTKSGECKEYYKDGKLFKIGSYKDGKKEGKWRTFRENGILWSIDFYKDGKRDGEWKSYRENGTLRKIRLYKDGVLIEIKKVSI